MPYMNDFGTPNAGQPDGLNAFTGFPVSTAARLPDGLNAVTAFPDSTAARLPDVLYDLTAFPDSAAARHSDGSSRQKAFSGIYIYLNGGPLCSPMTR